jgi:hypothetical protein
MTGGHLYIQSLQGPTWASRITLVRWASDANPEGSKRHAPDNVRSGSLGARFLLWRGRARAGEGGRGRARAGAARSSVKERLQTRVTVQTAPLALTSQTAPLALTSQTAPLALTSQAAPLALTQQVAPMALASQARSGAGVVDAPILEAERGAETYGFASSCRVISLPSRTVLRSTRPQHPRTVSVQSIRPDPALWSGVRSGRRRNCGRSETS